MKIIELDAIIAKLREFKEHAMIYNGSLDYEIEEYIEELTKKIKQGLF